jgi:GMP synthase (glutamine-hydrolysing)
MPLTVAIRHVPFEDLGVLEPLLVSRGHDIHHLNAGVDDVTDRAVEDADLLVVLGGPIGVNDEAAYPFLADELRVIERRLELGRPMLGVCLGAQLIAHAAGATVRSTGRQEIGYSPLTLTASGEASALASLGPTPVLHWHGDEFSIPSGAASLAATPGFPNQAFSLGSSVLALQFHLEADHRQIERWLIGHAHELATAGIDPAGIRSDAAEHGLALAAAATRVFDSWLGQVGVG